MKIKIKNTLVFIICVFTVIAITHRLFVGYETDEEYLLAMLYKYLQGDVLFRDFFEPHQLSIIVLILPFKYKQLLFGKNFDLLYLRVLGLFMLCLAAYVFIRIVYKYYNKDKQLLIILFCLLITYLPKFTYTFDYGLQTYVAILGLVSCVINKDKSNVLPGYIVCSVLLLLAYPTMFPIVFVVVLYLDSKERIWYLFATTVITITLVLYYTYDLQALSYAKNILTDASHKTSFIDTIKFDFSGWYLQFIFLVVLICVLQILKELKSLNTFSICLILVIFAIYFCYNFTYLIGFNSLCFLLFVMCLFLKRDSIKGYLLITSVTAVVFISSNMAAWYPLRYCFLLLILALVVVRERKLSFIIGTSFLLLITTQMFALEFSNMYKISECTSSSEADSLRGIKCNEYQSELTKHCVDLLDGLDGSLQVVGYSKILYTLSDLYVSDINTISTGYYDSKYTEYTEPDYVYMEPEHPPYSEDYLGWLSSNYKPIDISNVGILYQKK